MKKTFYGFLTFFVINMLIIFLVGCSDTKGTTYTIERGTNGTIYRLNKNTGSIVAIIGINAFEVSMPESWTKGGGKLSEAKNWPAQTIPMAKDNLSISMKTAWRDGKLYYKISTPYNEHVNKLRNDYKKSISPVFYDKSNFKLLQIDVPLRSMTRILGENRKVAFYEYEGTKECSPDKYADIASWNVMWNFE